MSTKALYVISVAAALVDMSAATLRRYERAGLLSPARTRGGLRLYSDEDVAVLRQIRYLAGEWGVSMAGMTALLDLTQRLLALQELLESDKFCQVDRDRQALTKIEEALAILGR
ncbi:MAG: MerR family transcriptional regulator [Chloroflexota bacterium]